MIHIYFYKFTGERIKVNKTSEMVSLFKQGNVDKPLEGTLKESTLITDPVVTVELDNDIVTKGLNYIYIQEFGRYYFVENITAVQSKIFKLTCHVDVLMSFREALLNADMKAVIDRTEDDRLINVYINDDKYICNADPYIATTPFTTDGHTQFKFGQDFQWVLSIAGAGHET